MRRCLALTLALSLCGVLATQSDARYKRKPKPTPAPTPTPSPIGFTPTTNPPPRAGFTLPPQSYGYTKDTVEIFPPPKAYPLINPWAEAFVDTRTAGTGTVTMQYLRVFATIGGQTTCVVNLDYTQQAMTGGFYTRWPWYGGNGVPLSLWSLPATSGGITVMVTDPSKISHWFNGPHVSIAGATDVWAQCAVKITGNTAFDFGWDYYDAGGNLVEGASTRIYEASDCPTMTVLTIGK